MAGVGNGGPGRILPPIRSAEHPLRKALALPPAQPNGQPSRFWCLPWNPQNGCS